MKIGEIRKITRRFTMGILVWVLSVLSVYMLRNDKVQEIYRYSTVGVSIVIILGYLVFSVVF